MSLGFSRMLVNPPLLLADAPQEIEAGLLNRIYAAHCGVGWVTQRLPTLQIEAQA